MKSKFVAAREFVRGCAARADGVVIISKGRALIDQGIAHTSVVGVEGSGWCGYFDTEWDASAIAIARLPSPKVVVIGEDGDVATRAKGKNDREKLPGQVVAIRNARTIAGQVFACGMQRQVYRRVDESKWLDVSAPSGAPTDAVGFEALDGFSDTEIYAAGWGGEVWQFDGVNWVQHGGVTNVVLSSVCCAVDGMTYVGGQRGTMIRGRGSRWELVQWKEPTDEDIWDLCWFDDRLFVATMTGLYMFERDTLLEVDTSSVDAASFFSLTAAEGVLWSIGRDDVLSYDGRAWKQYD